MKTLKTSLTPAQLKGLRNAYQSIGNGKEKMWLSANTGEVFDREKEGIKFSESLKSKAMKKMEEGLSRIYGS
ncbi:MAG: hypothetical protein WAV76_10105, partial [Bacteroidota bacterium]